MPKLYKWWKDNNPCTTSVFKTEIVNSVHSSRESVRCSGTKTSDKIRHSFTDAVDATELFSLNTIVKNIEPTGKR
jgi:hypothetical protein